MTVARTKLNNVKGMRSQRGFKRTCEVWNLAKFAAENDKELVFKTKAFYCSRRHFPMSKFFKEKVNFRNFFGGCTRFLEVVLQKESGKENNTSKEQNRKVTLRTSQNPFSAPKPSACVYVIQLCRWLVVEFTEPRKWRGKYTPTLRWTGLLALAWILRW